MKNLTVFILTLAVCSFMQASQSPATTDKVSSLVLVNASLGPVTLKLKNPQKKVALQSEIYIKPKLTIKGTKVPHTTLNVQGFEVSRIIIKNMYIPDPKGETTITLQEGEGAVLHNITEDIIWARKFKNWPINSSEYIKNKAAAILVESKPLGETIGVSIPQVLSSSEAYNILELSFGTDLFHALRMTPIHLDSVTTLLWLIPDPNIQAPDNGDTPLHYAVRDNNKALVIRLLTFGARIDIKNKAGQTPYDLALSKPDILKILLKAGYGLPRRDTY